MTTEKKEKKRIFLPVFNIKGQEVDKTELDVKVFDGRLSTGSVYRTVHNYLANKRNKNASTKTRAEVAGSGKKPWKQKGTGRARIGSVRSPVWRHGGVVFGPRPRDFSYALPKKIKKLSLHSILNDRALNNQIVVLDSLRMEEGKTKKFQEIIKNLKLDKKILLVLSSWDDKIKRSVRNIPEITLVGASDVNTYDIILSERMIITLDALRELSKRLK